MKQVFKVIFRYPDKAVDEFMTWAAKYCQFMDGPDQRGRGHGSDASTLKVLKKELEAKFGSIEAARQTLARNRQFRIINSEGIEVRLDSGSTSEGFKLAMQWIQQLTKDWLEKPVYVGLYTTYKTAEQAAMGRENKIFTTQISSNVFAIDIK